MFERFFGRHDRPIISHTILSFLFVASMGAVYPAQAKDYGEARVSTVSSIYDGDTFRADIEGWPPIIGERMPVRLRGVDTPELRGDCDREIKQARAAKQFTVTRLRQAKTIRLKQVDRGKYFRLVADVKVDGQDLGEMLLQAGLARTYDGGTRRSWCD